MRCTAVLEVFAAACPERREVCTTNETSQNQISSHPKGYNDNGEDGQIIDKTSAAAMTEYATVEQKSADFGAAQSAD